VFTLLGRSSKLIEDLIARFRFRKTFAWHEQVRLPILKVFRQWFDEFGHHLEGTAYTFIDTLCDFVNEETAVYPSEESHLTYLKVCICWPTFFSSCVCGFVSDASHTAKGIL
jgi:hypothetical protein